MLWYEYGDTEAIVGEDVDHLVATVVLLQRLEGWREIRLSVAGAVEEIAQDGEAGLPLQDCHTVAWLHHDHVAVEIIIVGFTGTDLREPLLYQAANGGIGNEVYK